MHTCDNPPCCNPAHLRCGTQKENIEDKYTKGREDPRSGGRNHMAKLTGQQVAEIRSRVACERGVDLAREYGVSKATISEIKNRRHWV